jgi:N6-adenosine-specific RNA methylase IME4
MQFHELANVFPLIEGDEFAALVADIGKQGLLEAIVLLDGKILDGRNRYRACLEAGVEPHFEEFDGEDAVAFVVSKNVARRHLDESQRALAAARIATLQRGGNQHSEGLPIGRSSQLLNVGERSVHRARDVLDQGTPELIEAVERGQIAVSKAAELTRAAPEFQRAVVAKINSDDVRPQEAIRRVKAETIAKSEMEAPSGKYRVIYADPPWSYGNTSIDKLGEQRDHYPVMTLKEICDLPVKDMAQDDAVLFLWTTSPMLEECFDVIRAWGFKYKASFVWDKIKHNMGHYNSVRHEFLLVCVRGSCQPDVRQLFDSVVSIERTEHSKKPEEFAKIIDTIYPNGSRIELFSRVPRHGWAAWGYEAGDAAA